MIVLICFALTLCACADEGTNTVKAYFSALNKGDYTEAGRLLGDESFYADLTKENSELSYYEQRDMQLFTETVYGGLSVTVKKSEKTEDGYLIEGELEAYNVGEINAYLQSETEKLMASDEYVQAEEAAKYVMLCESLKKIYEDMTKNLYKVSTPLTFSVKRNESGWYIEPTPELMKAITGGYEQ